VQIQRLTVRDFRNHERFEFEPSAGLTVIEGPVGAGKTNLLEALYAACVGRSFRTSNDRELIRFGSEVARAATAFEQDDLEHTLELVVPRSGSKLIRNDGVRLDRPADASTRPLVCVFAPDRLELVKGAAGMRRAHLDEIVAALWPARRDTRRQYARALAQRNSLLTRVRAGTASAASLGGWTSELARHGLQLMVDRSSAVELLSPRFAELSAELGLTGTASLSYRPRAPASDVNELELELHDRLPTDLERGFTTHGPHRDDLSLELEGRPLRRFGSQGQQRLALLALLCAERDVLAASHGETPVLLLDDVLSELDAERRALLLALLGQGGQALLTTADPSVTGPSDALARVPLGGAARDTSVLAPA
jgi:DNA replication and repair protein RecF